MEQTNHMPAQHAANGGGQRPDMMARLNSIDALWGETWKRYCERFMPFMEILLVPTLAMMLGYVLMALGGAFALLGGLVYFVGVIAFAFSMLPLTYSIHHGTAPDASYKATLRLFWPGVWVAILRAFAVLGAFVMLIIPGIWLSVALSFFIFALVLEDRRGLDTLRQSKEYVKGYWWAIVGRLLLLMLPYIVLVMIVQIPTALIAGRLATTIFGLILSLLFIPFCLIYSYLIYQNIRALKPDVANASATKSGTGFLKASAIVGVVAIPLMIIAFIAAITIAVTSGLFQHIGNHWTVNKQLIDKQLIGPDEYGTSSQSSSSVPPPPVPSNY